MLEAFAEKLNEESSTKWCMAKSLGLFLVSVDSIFGVVNGR